MDELIVVTWLVGFLCFLWELFAVKLKFDKLLDQLYSLSKTEIAKFIFLGLAWLCCVKLPKTCSIIYDIDNGKVNCTAGFYYNYSVGSSCFFTCETNYKIDGLANVTCTEDEKWVPHLPTCKLITCPDFEDPPHVISNCSDKNIVSSECRFVCDEKHKMIGFETIVCQVDGTWSHPIPTCTLRKCMPPPEIAHGKWNCSDITYTVGSSCTIQCVNGHEFQDEDITLTCHSDETWSGALPRCVCPSCKTGAECEYTTSWRIFKERITRRSSGFKADYGGHQISCERQGGFHKWKFKWKCRCTDVAMGYPVECSGYKSGYGACEHATAELIRQMISKGIYPESCDGPSMIEGC